jgi:S-adenosylmethionine:tRNA ribosyltransferase-isomerase
MFPPYKFQVANCMVTNFHLPKSTLMMQVGAFGGYDLIMKAYKIAVKKKYRFHTFGDAMLILP